ncbi:ACP phosphodiesterase [Robertkochia solimangrovi]|uniref:acyl carrier protein phosphodiesterase n=1 Tax=Robertkochia solimangrovi TaxID=2213046 RepID=UPI00117FC8D7|nr:acyl carrier protein phosphodiesterase [Robertkochia solimangrovi]TRZ45304.1 DUF479 domain-containing protein [Robertkochia solimangrovi]
MNYLAHIYLSGDNPRIKIGNFMADSIRGKKYMNYQGDFRKGILLHRAIDTFTDAHPVVRQSTKKLHNTYSHYSGVIVDIFYDHFLAKNWSEYSKIPLESFTEDFYDLLGEYYAVLPLNIKKMMPYMIADNWLYNYRTIEGIGRVLEGLNRRTHNRSGMNNATVELQQFYQEFEHEFRTFFQDINVFCSLKLKEL